MFSRGYKLPATLRGFLRHNDSVMPTERSSKWRMRNAKIIEASVV
jgi:hypothetical protein